MYFVLLSSAPFWLNLALKLNSESQFILRVGGCEGVSHSFSGVSGVSFGEPVVFHVFHETREMPP